MWGYFIDGKCVGTNPNNMDGNSGWEKVPDNTVPVEIEEFPTEVAIPLEQRVAAVEAVINGSPPLAEMVEALNVLLGD